MNRQIDDSAIITLILFGFLDHLPPRPFLHLPMSVNSEPIPWSVFPLAFFDNNLSTQADLFVFGYVYSACNIIFNVLLSITTARSFAIADPDRSNPHAFYCLRRNLEDRRDLLCRKKLNVHPAHPARAWPRAAPACAASSPGSWLYG